MAEIILKHLTPKSQRSFFGPILVGEANALSRQFKHKGVDVPLEVLEAHARTKVAHTTYESRLRKEIDVDALTGLSSRRAILREIDAAIQDANSNRGSLQVIFADIRDFKHLNDTYTHQTGDKALILVATGLKSQIKSGDKVGRYGGDEDLILVRSANTRVPEFIHERLHRALRKEQSPYSSIQVDFGVVDYNPVRDGALSAADLVHRADQAMYYAKSKGYATPARWNPSMANIEVPEST